MNGFVRLPLAVAAGTASVAPSFALSVLLSGDVGNELWWPTLFTALFIGAVGTVTIGMPLHLLLRWQGLVHPLWYAVPGFLVPAAFTGIVRPFGADGLGTVILQGSASGLIGAVAALAFWFVAVRWTAGPDR